MSINSRAGPRSRPLALHSTTLSSDNPNLNSVDPTQRRWRPYAASQSTLPCPTRRRNSPRPNQIVKIWEDIRDRTALETPETLAATAARHAKYIAAFYSSLDSLITATELNFICKVFAWAIDVAELERSESYTPPDFLAFYRDVIRGPKTYPVRIAALIRAAIAAAKAQTGRPVEKLELDTDERLGSCILFCRALCTGEESEGPRSGKGDSKEAMEMREWRRGWRDILELAVGKKPQQLVMRNVDWIFLCFVEIVPGLRDRIEDRDIDSMTRWLENELYHELPLRKDYRDPEVWNW